MEGGDIAGLTVMMIFSIPIIAIWTGHRQKMMEMKLKLKNQGSVDVRGDIEALRNEVRSLRETATQYDLSFDSALQRMEQRVEGLERRVYTPATENSTVEQRIGR